MNASAARWIARGYEALRQRNRLDEALAAFRRALQKDPASRDATLGLGIALRGAGRLLEARDTLEGLLAQHPVEVDGLVHLGVTLYRLDDLDGAIDSLCHAQRLAGNHEYARISLEGILANAPFDESIEVLERVVADNPNDVGARTHLGATVARRRQCQRSNARRQSIARALQQAGRVDRVEDAEGTSPVERASRFYRLVRDLEVIPDIRPSELWVSHIRTVLEPAMAACPSAAEVVRDVTARDLFSYPRRKDHPDFHRLIHHFSQHFTLMGHPLDSFDSLVQESHLASPLVTTELGERVVSTVFLYHLSIAWRVVSRVGRDAGQRILELGGGFGGLARATKILAPQTNYFIVDLPESLWFSYTYLSGNFPNARILFCTNPEEQNFDDYDFVLVPIGLLSVLFGRRFDAVVNTASLGEMTETATDRYLQFLHEDIETRFFYSLNRYGQHQSNERYLGVRVGSPDCASVPIRLDPFWRVHLWNIVGDNSFSLIETHSPPQLELLVERVPRALLSDGYRRSLSQRLLQEALLMPEQNHRWQFLIWESIRLFPTHANVSVYVDFLGRHGYVELEHYQALRDCLSDALG